jgi:hypothetical protein
MTYFVVAYPELEQPDFDWIQKYREQNDRQFSIVKPHFTLVFAIKDIDKTTLLGEVKRQASSLKPFDFEIKLATINQDDSGEYYHEFLVPDKGYSDIVELHNKLYSGVLASSQRFDIDFIPHISIGDSEDVHASKKRTDALNAQGILVSGHVGSLDVLELADGKVSTVEKVRL